MGRVCTIGSGVGLCFPSFCLAIALMLVFLIHLNWLPRRGAESWRSLVLPAVTMAPANSAVLARYTRVAVRGSLDSRHVAAAFAPGIPFWRIFDPPCIAQCGAPILTILGFFIDGAVTALPWSRQSSQGRVYETSSSLQSQTGMFR
ncbi:ABC transporter permease subunit [Bradyrhizobium sp. 179]|nr:ABC transporter permease subunit [Bradyrhizobium sp. 179]